MEQTVPKRRYIKYRRRGITRKKEYNIQNTAKGGNNVISYIYSFIPTVSLSYLQAGSPVCACFSFFVIFVVGPSTHFLATWHQFAYLGAKC